MTWTGAIYEGPRSAACHSRDIGIYLRDPNVGMGNEASLNYLT